MEENKIIIDSNTYFRLAQSIHPLLKVFFGAYRLWITDDLGKEVESSQRLQSKFGWFNQEEYKSNRTAVIQLSRKQKKQFESDRDNLIQMSSAMGYPGLSREDINLLTYALILEVPLVTDDLDLAAFSKAVDAKVLTTLELMKLMLDQSHLTIEKVRAITKYWISINDTPSAMATEYKRIFKEDLPTLE